MGAPREFVFVGHPIDSGGAPLVLLQIVGEYLDRYGAKHVRLITPSYTEAARPRLEALPITLEKGAAMSPRLSGLQLALRRDDFVLLNTCSVHQGYVDHVLGALESGTLARAHWFIHEDLAQLQVISPHLIEEPFVARISRLLNSGQLSLMVPTGVVRQSYNAAFRTREVARVAYRVDVPGPLQRARATDEYERLDFLLAGPPFKGRKGHALALAAFREFMNRYRRADPSRYREFSLHLVGLREEDLLSQQIQAEAEDILGSRVHVYPTLPRERALAITASCNAVISCSVSETFGLSVAEAMLMHHVVLRNDTGGVDEQLRDGENGYFIGHNDAAQFAAAIEQALNRGTTNNADLQAMGRTSHEMMVRYSQNEYRTQIEALPVHSAAVG